MKIRILLFAFWLWCTTAFGQVPYPLTFGVGPVLHFDDTSVTKYFQTDTSLANNIWQVGHHS